MQDLMKLNISYILIDAYNKNQANTIFNQALYQIPYNFFLRKGYHG